MSADQTKPNATPETDAALGGWTDRMVSQSRLIPADDFANLRDRSRSLETSLIATQAELAALRTAGREPVAWRCRGRASASHVWELWRVFGHKPQGPANERFQIEPLYAGHAVSDAAPDGMVLVPREPTEKMAEAYLTAQREACLANDRGFGVSVPKENFKSGYRAMLSAAPKAGA